MENKDNWICLASKTRPGRYYMFNKATGETQWQPLKQDEGKSESPPKISFSKSSKTPAQDRLKRLQHNLNRNQTRSQSSRSTRLSSDLEGIKKYEQENLLTEQPSTSSSTKATSKSPKKLKRLSSNCISNEVEDYIKDFQCPTEDRAKKLHLPKSLNINTTCATSTSNNSETVEYFVKKKENNSCTLTNLRTGIVKKIKEICKIPFNKSKKITEEKSSAKEEKSPSLLNVTQFKHKRKTNDTKTRLTLTAAQTSIDQLKKESGKTYNLKVPTSISEISTPTNKIISSYPRGSANSRLEKLKQSLLSQQRVQPKSFTTSNSLDTSRKTLEWSLETNNNNNKTLTKVNNTGHNDNLNSLFHTANDEVEAMDWQTILKDEDTDKMSSTAPTLVIEKSKKLLLDKDAVTTNETMGDIYDRVNENLLRFSAEKQKDSSNNIQQWQRDFYYFIVDTNVLLRDLTFVEDLTRMELCDTKGSMLYIPYSVLQELDKLKMRSGCQKDVKTLAVRVIKYLNGKFENNSPYLQAQSAFDERRRLVDINSADDSIINCCLQAKEHVPNLLLLTEDVNLRNKAICNKILVSTKSDLVSKRYNASDTDNNSWRKKFSS